MAQPSGLRTSARGLGWARLLVGALVLGAAMWLKAAGAFPYSLPLFLLCVGGLTASGALALLAPARLAAAPRLAWLQVLLDVVLVTALVAASGGARSLFTFLYVLAVMEACLVFSRAGGLVVAGCASLLYVGLVLGRTILPLLDLGEPTETTALEVLTVFVNAGALMVSAIVAGSLAERYYLARRDLEVQQRHLSDLQAFRDLIFESVGTGLVALDPEGRITAFNRAAETIAGVPAALALGRPWEAVFGRQVDLDEVREVVARGEPSRRYEFQLLRRDGQRMPVGIAFWLLRAGDGRAVGLIGVCQDLSSIKQMEERMRQADRLAALGRLSANIAHEIRNPLASVSGAIEALARELPPDAVRSRLVEIVLQESARLNQLIAEFLDYARPAPPALLEVNLARVLDDVLVLLEHRPLPPAVKLHREYVDPLPTRADPQQIRQALWNLCLNAVQAMPAGGELRVGGRLSDGTGGRVEVWVADTGQGIPPDDLPHIFEPFYSRRPGGSGLGLAVVYRVVQEHGGTLDVRSAPGAGTRFTLALPGA